MAVRKLLTLTAIACFAFAGAASAKHKHRASTPLAMFLAQAPTGPGPTSSGWLVSYPNVYYSNGGVLLPLSVTGGSQGVGSINVSKGYYVNGVPLASMPVSPSTMPAFVLPGDCLSNAGTVILKCYSRTTVTDSSRTGTTTDQTIEFVGLTAPRTYTLPPASSYEPGKTLTIMTGDTSCTTVNTITAQPSGSDTFVALTSNPYLGSTGAMRFTVTSSNKWLLN